jgi:predicted ATPase
VDARRSNLVAERTPLFGRREELARLGALFAGGARLVTLVGPPGVGKTRLARRYALDVGLEEQGQAWFCDLSAAASEPEALAVVAGVLAVPLTGRAPGEQLAEAVASRGAVLLVLDNFEQLARTATGVAVGLLARAPAARLLVTSREALNITGEARVELGPLGPEEALGLFLDRAAAAGAVELATLADRAVLAEIVERLDRMPLAIELAAARAPMLSPADLLARLSERFEICRGRLRDRQPRQLSLETAIEASWALLDASEQHALAQASVFRGGFSLEAAEAVLDLPDGGSPLDVLEALHDKSLLRALPARDAPIRYDLYESIRDFAAARLAVSPRDWTATARRHAEHFVAEGSVWAARVAGSRGAEAVRWLRREADNLGAVARGAAVHDRSLAARAVLALSPMLACTGPLATHRELCDLGLGAAEEGGQKALAARLFLERATLRRAAGEQAAAREDAEAGVALARALGDEHLEAEHLCLLGHLAWDANDIAEARARFERALDRCAKLGEIAVIGRVERGLGYLAYFGGDLDAGRAHFERALAIHDANDDRRAEVGTLLNYGVFEHHGARLDRARALYERALSLYHRIDDPLSGCTATAFCGILEHELGHYDRARALYEQAIAAAESLGARTRLDLPRYYRGLLALELGRPEEAVEHVARALALAREVRDARLTGWCLMTLAAAHAARGAKREADATFAEARRVVEELAFDQATAGLEVYLGFLDVAALPSAPQGEARALASSAARRRDAPSEPGAPDERHPGGRPSMSGRSIPVRFAQRALAAAIARLEPPETLAPADALVVEASGSWLRTPGGERVALDQPLLGALLRALCTQRERRPGEPLSTDALIAAGWPGERILVDAAHNRLRVAIARLRSKGLGALLRTERGGYLLDPGVTLVRVAPTRAAGTEDDRRG